MYTHCRLQKYTSIKLSIYYKSVHNSVCDYNILFQVPGSKTGPEIVCSFGDSW